ncbi:Indoleamine 2,3-dioxygenase [Echria macrotheca]|uniref:Indoleamine 2,3-dioxygenase n=1 Tax=Echria macrotheca TaxID=438768 RepID=A0AAJ0F7P5_9PEZI|nr:Indoleamine 2,3-dioxygenase [Echria macrotheca]
MSPPEPLPRHLEEPNISEILEKFSISQYGFLPDDPPLVKLPDDYYAPWERLISHLPSLLETKTLRSQVDALPILSTSRLSSAPEHQRAYVILCFLAHGYIWGGDLASQTLPPPIAIPLLAISSKLDLPPVATYAALNLWNFSPNNTPTDLDSLRSQHTFTGTQDESWFYCVSIAIEARGAKAIPLMLRALHHLQSGDFSRAAADLRRLAACIDELGELLGRMDERCDPGVFFHRIRPFLAGSKNMAAVGLPRGVFYDEGPSGSEEETETGRRGGWRALRGGSNGQSSLIQFFDIVLGVEHAGGFHEEVRAYMPRPHRLFLEWLAETYRGGVRQFLLLEKDSARKHGRESEVEECEEAFRMATDALAAFRGRHLKMVTRYIIIPSSAGRGDEKVINLATASAGDKVGAIPHKREASPYERKDRKVYLQW